MLEKSGFKLSSCCMEKVKKCYLPKDNCKAVRSAVRTPTFNITLEWTKPTSTVTINHNFRKPLSLLNGTVSTEQAQS